MARTQPHAAYCAYIHHGLSSRWTILSRTIPDIADLLQPLEEAVQQNLSPILTGRPSCSSMERDLLALPVRMGGMGLVNQVSSSQHVFNAFLQLTLPLVSTIASQDQNQTVDIGRVMKIKASIRQSNQKHWLQKSRYVHDQLSPQLKHLVDLAKEKGASSWFSVLPLNDHGFSLHKGAFGDAICLLYG